MIRATDNKHKDFIEEVDDGKDYIIRTDKLPFGETIACSDDNDMTVIKNSDGTIILNKKCYSKSPFSKK